MLIRPPGVGKRHTVIYLITTIYKQDELKDNVVCGMNKLKNNAHIPLRSGCIILCTNMYIIYIYIYVTCHAKTRPSAHYIILRKTITNTEHKRSIEFEFFIYHESTMTHFRGDTFEIFI